MIGEGHSSHARTLTFGNQVGDFRHSIEDGVVGVNV